MNRSCQQLFCSFCAGPAIPSGSAYRWKATVDILWRSALNDMRHFSVICSISERTVLARHARGAVIRVLWFILGASKCNCWCRCFAAFHYTNLFPIVEPFETFHITLLFGVLRRKRPMLFDWKVSNSSLNRAPAWPKCQASFQIRPLEMIFKGRNSNAIPYYCCPHELRYIFSTINSVRKYKLNSAGPNNMVRCATVGGRLVQKSWATKAPESVPVG